MADTEYDTVTVLGSKTVLRPDGRTVIVLKVQRPAKEPYLLAVEIGLHAIGVLRENLAVAELHLKTQIGRA